MAASSTQGDLFRGLRFWTEPSGRLRLEGTVELASKYTGLANRTIHHYIEDGEIEARQPGANRSDQVNARGRRKSWKCLVDMRDVFRIAYGEEKAAALCRELGVEPKAVKGVNGER